MGVVSEDLRLITCNFLTKTEMGNKKIKNSTLPGDIATEQKKNSISSLFVKVLGLFNIFRTI